MRSVARNRFCEVHICNSRVKKAAFHRQRYASEGSGMFPKLRRFDLDIVSREHVDRS